MIEQVTGELNNHGYTDDYYRKMNYYNGGLENTKIPLWVYILLVTLSIGLVASIYKINILQKKLKKV